MVPGAAASVPAAAPARPWSCVPTTAEHFGAGPAAVCFAHQFEQHCALSLAVCLQANAEHFGPELPFVEGGSKRVLYPASNKASTELQVGSGVSLVEKQGEVKSCCRQAPG